MLQPVSVQSAAGTSHDATAAADQLDEPPGTLFFHHGFMVFLFREFSPVDHMANSSIFSFHIEFIQAFFKFFITVAS